MYRDSEKWEFVKWELVIRRWGIGGELVEWSTGLEMHGSSKELRCFVDSMNEFIGMKSMVRMMTSSD
jgi:hypothetical protein